MLKHHDECHNVHLTIVFQHELGQHESGQHDSEATRDPGEDVYAQGPAQLPASAPAPPPQQHQQHQPPQQQEHQQHQPPVDEMAALMQAWDEFEAARDEQAISRGNPPPTAKSEEEAKARWLARQHEPWGSRNAGPR